MKKGKRYRKQRREKQVYFGMALLVMLFIVAGLTTAIRGGERRDVETFDTATESDLGLVDETSEKRAAEKENPNIRVVIMTDGFSHITHDKIQVSSESGMTVFYGENGKKTYKKGEMLTIKPDHEWFSDGVIKIRPEDGKVKVHNLKRGDGAPEYAGMLELRTTQEGIVLINELPVETYLCGVVPSEMPASYDLEALKAQAVCARSYAWRQMQDYGYPEYKAHVNDSTDYQVYNNSQESERSSLAVKETEGEVALYRDKVATTYYYSTSCGKTTTMEAWGTKPDESNGYLYSAQVKGENGDYEKNLPWYRWTAVVSAETLSDLIGLNTGKDIGTVNNLKVTERGPGDVALEIKVSGEKGTVTVKTENKIRAALGGSGYEIEKKDGTVIDSQDLLPSAFFSVKKKEDKFIIRGGGFGHGIGMSQNGANEMAKQGRNYKEILGLFYRDISIE